MIFVPFVLHKNHPILLEILQLIAMSILRRIARLSEHTKSLTLNYCNQCLKAILEKLVCDKDHNYENVPDAILIELSTNWESVVIALSKIVISIYRGVRIPSLTEGATTEPTLGGPEDSDARRSMVSKSVTALIGTGIHATLAKGLTANGLEHIYYVSVIALLAGLEKQKEEANYDAGGCWESVQSRVDDRQPVLH